MFINKNSVGSLEATRWAIAKYSNLDNDREHSKFNLDRTFREPRIIPPGCKNTETEPNMVFAGFRLDLTYFPQKYYCMYELF